MPMAQCIKDPEQECLGLAEARVIMHKIEQIVDRQNKEYEENRAAHKEFYNRIEFGERAQAVTQTQLAQILADTGEIKGAVIEQSKEISAILQKPTKHWDAAIGAAIVAVVGFLLKSVGIF